MQLKITFKISIVETHVERLQTSQRGHETGYLRNAAMKHAQRCEVPQLGMRGTDNKRIHERRSTVTEIERVTRGEFNVFQVNSRCGRFQNVQMTIDRCQHQNAQILPNKRYTSGKQWLGRAMSEHGVAVDDNLQQRNTTTQLWTERIQIIE